jgi:hypothetical protein
LKKLKQKIQALAMEAGGCKENLLPKGEDQV